MSKQLPITFTPGQPVPHTDSYQGIIMDSIMGMKRELQTLRTQLPFAPDVRHALHEVNLLRMVIDDMQNLFISRYL